MKTMYKILLITSVITIHTSCSINAQDEKLTEAEAFIEELYNKSFNNVTTETESKLSTIQLYKKIEDFYLSLGILDGIKKNNYQVLYKQYMQTDSTINLPGLYNIYPEIESLETPSNYTINFYAFDEAMRKYGSKIPHESSLYKASTAIDAMYTMDFVFEEEEILFKKYLDLTNDEDFENKFIYRIPIIAFSHDVFVDRYRKERQAIKK